MGNVVLGKELGFDRRGETCRETMTIGGYVQFELGRKVKERNDRYALAEIEGIWEDAA